MQFVVSSNILLDVSCNTFCKTFRFWQLLQITGLLFLYLCFCKKFLKICFVYIHTSLCASPSEFWNTLLLMKIFRVTHHYRLFLAFCFTASAFVATTLTWMALLL